MRKLNPEDLKDAFVTNLDDLRDFYISSSQILLLDSQKTFQVENSLLAAAVQWEGFISDLLVAYINRNSSRFVLHLKDALESQMSDKQKTIYHRYATLSVPLHLKKSDIQDIVDGSGNNITFSNYQLLLDRAKTWLVPEDFAKFSSRSKREQSVVNALIALRNHLAHRSERSLNAMNEALSKGELHSLKLKRGQNNVHHVGAYLKSKVGNANLSRFEIFLKELSLVAKAL